ncbi:MAG: 16S rRNA (guanine(966)-N(2))-methyltransferase RsmD, partial [Gammaproteobacteria bacterium]
HNIVHMAKKQATSRIIAGDYKGTKLSFKPNKNLRPTESKTKETLFNWLLNDLHKKKCLDMFAGTGALGLEALSRGAEEVIFFEKQKALCGAIEVVVKKLGVKNKCRVINANSTAFDFKKLNTKFDLIFLDPPFNESLIQKSLNIISENELLTDKGLVYIECERGLDLESLRTDLTQLKLSRGGETKYCLYES